jgi:hypothetical protein
MEVGVLDTGSYDGRVHCYHLVASSNPQKEFYIGCTVLEEGRLCGTSQNSNIGYNAADWTGLWWKHSVLDSSSGIDFFTIGTDHLRHFRVLGFLLRH